MEVMEKTEPERAWRTNMKPKPAQASNPPSHNTRDDSLLHTVCPGSSDLFYIVSYKMKWVTTSWTHRIILLILPLAMLILCYVFSVVSLKGVIFFLIFNLNSQMLIHQMFKYTYIYIRYI